MLDKLLKLTTIHEVRKKLNANDIRGEAAASLEAEWIKVKDAEADTIDITSTISEDDTEKTASPVMEELEVDISTKETVLPPVYKKPFRTINSKK